MSTRIDIHEDRLNAIFHALSNPTRRGLLARLCEANLTIGELAAPLEMSLPAVSKHVRVLEAAGLLRREVDGRVHRCSFDAEPLESAAEWIARYRAFWTDTLAALADHVEQP